MRRDLVARCDVDPTEQERGELTARCRDPGAAQRELPLRRDQHDGAGKVVERDPAIDLHDQVLAGAAERGVPEPVGDPVVVLAETHRQGAPSARS